MSKARLVITAVTVEKRPVSEVARSYGVARSWVYELLARYQAEGEAAFEPRSRRPKNSPGVTAPGTVEHRGVDVDGDHLRDLADQAGREEPVAAAHVQDRGGPGGDARRRPGVVVNVDVPFLGHTG
jgi:hypothetical protein